ncbi:hypothetical protein N9Q92_00735 [Flavobacteriaceae bacterium]|nr:hypothetical protein [Flavobacteriaceae bacterium]
MGKLVLPYLYGRQKNKVKIPTQKILIISYYWPPAGGSGVQRWMYFAKYLKQLGWDPIVITVDEGKASYAVWDKSLLEEVEDIHIIKTTTMEPLRWYSLLTTGSSQKGIPQGEVKRKSALGKFAAFVRGNFFIPDARKGWIPFAIKAAQKVLKEETISYLVTTGPPHSTHLAGLQLKEQFDVKWWVDFRDPWTDIFYNSEMYRSKNAIQKDLALEKKVLQAADGVLTTVGGALHDKLRVRAPRQKFISIPNGYDTKLFQEIKRIITKKVFHVVYTGLLTQNQDYESVLRILSNLKAPVRLSLAGNINQEIVEGIRLKYPKIELIFHGYIPHREAIQLMKSAHLLLNFIFEGAHTQMISGKILEYIATEVPVLSIGDPNSEAGKFIAQGSAAKMLEAQDNQGILEFIEQVASQKDHLQNSFPNIERWSREGLTKRLVEEIMNG